MAGSDVRAPWHFWVVAVASLLWSAYGCYEYYSAQIGHYVHMQAWAVAAWATAVWGALLGSILLLLRNKWAFRVLAACFVVGAIEMIYALWRSGGAPVFAIMMGVNGVVSLSFIWYAGFAAKRGILR